VARSFRPPRLYRQTCPLPDRRVPHRTDVSLRDSARKEAGDDQWTFSEVGLEPEHRSRQRNTPYRCRYRVSFCVLSTRRAAAFGDLASLRQQLHSSRQRPDIEVSEFPLMAVVVNPTPWRSPMSSPRSVWRGTFSHCRLARSLTGLTAARRWPSQDLGRAAVILAARFSFWTIADLGPPNPGRAGFNPGRADQGGWRVVCYSSLQAIVPGLVASDALEHANGLLTGTEAPTEHLASPVIGTWLLAMSNAVPYFADAVATELSDQMGPRPRTGSAPASSSATADCGSCF
jgi:hypothetical protein